MSSRARFNKGATTALYPLLSDGEWHPLDEVVRLVEPFLRSGELRLGASELASGMNCERMGIRGRGDQQVRWRPDLYLEATQRGHDRANLKMGAEVVLRALSGLRSFQHLATDPGQQLNPAQRYWLDKSLEMLGKRIAEGGGD